MKKIAVGIILVLALIGFGLQPTRGKAVPVDLSALRSMPLVLGPFRASANNDMELTSSASITDGSIGLERTYRDDDGRKLEIVVVPQTIGQHVPLLCDRYGGYAIVSESQMSLPGIPKLRFNELTVRGNSDHLVTTCAYYWKTADGFFAPEPNHSLGLIAARWSDHQQGLFVNVCSVAGDTDQTTAEKALESLLGETYPEVSRLFPAVFRNSTKD